MLLIARFAALLITTGALQAGGYLAYRRTRRDWVIGPRGRPMSHQSRATIASYAVATSRVASGEMGERVPSVAAE